MHSKYRTLLHPQKTAHSLSPPQRPLCIVGRLEKGKKKARGEQWKGEREEARFFSLPIVPRAFRDFPVIAILYPTGASAEIKRIGSSTFIKRTSHSFFFHGKKQLNKPNRQSKEKGSAKKTILKN